ncbi:hypothetical protein AV530_005075 [Patagioenas fasciata monilis]|uniref:Uncharacterized protein n=1 Tax=Patagioenas fasciata monilis TaxID=372326 RepID=A0A1V4K439_PATFA|nr:hypothetical protein AV530_005075 [Patagioenas fasciata monilis]
MEAKSRDETLEEFSGIPVFSWSCSIFNSELFPAVKNPMDEITPSLTRGDSGVKEMEPCGDEAVAVPQPSRKFPVSCFW